MEDTAISCIIGCGNNANVTKDGLWLCGECAAEYAQLKMLEREEEADTDW